ncbi:MAG: O-antigen ligase family protein [Desulfovibrio sp.]|nr:O-antigen ligase family protein [Desulfovibrio sp.]
MFRHVAAARERLRALWDALRTAHAERPADFWHSWLFAAFWTSLATFPAGYGLREAMPLLCLVFLVPYYRHAWRESVLARLNVKWLFLCAAGMTLIGIAASSAPLASLLHAGTGVNKGFILPFIGMECVRNGRDLRRLVWACVFACFWQGLDGLWQAATGADFIMGYKRNAGRLTGSLGDYSVGNYIALALIPAFGAWFLLRRALGAAAALLVFAALLWPAFFLLEGASSRSGVLAIAGVLALWALLRYRRLNWRALLWPCLVLGAFSLLQPARLSPLSISGDNRWDLWKLGWNVFLEHPWFGAGAGQYNPAFRSLGLAPEREVITISHPHNIFLDMLYAHGLVGFTLGMVFLLGFLWWGWRRIRPRLLEECAAADAKAFFAPTGGSVYWRLTAWFWLGYAGWLVNGIFGHDFYRIWWLGLAMSYLGVMVGAVVNGPDTAVPADSGPAPLPAPMPPPPGAR